MGKKFPSKWNPKASRSSYTYIRQSRLQTKIVKRDKQCHFILINGTIQLEEVKMVNTYTANVYAPDFIKQILLDIKTRIDPLTK
jgi:hypothetical protein